MEVDSESEESESEEEEVVDEPIAEEDEEEGEEDDDVVIVDQQQQSSTMEEGGGGGGDAGLQRSRKEIDNERKDLELGELLEMMEDWKPIVSSFLFTLTHTSFSCFRFLAVLFFFFRGEGDELGLNVIRSND